jgi:hypothetical protein
MKNVNDVKKELYKSKVNAKLTSVVSGTMYYTVPLEDGLYQFPIETVEAVKRPLYVLEAKTQTSPKIDLTYTKVEETLYVLSADLGTTLFDMEMKASDLNRWIAKAIEKGEFVKV